MIRFDICLNNWRVCRDAYRIVLLRHPKLSLTLLPDPTFHSWQTATCHLSFHLAYTRKPTTYSFMHCNTTTISLYSYAWFFEASHHYQSIALCTFLIVLVLITVLPRGNPWYLTQTQLMELISIWKDLLFFFMWDKLFIRKFK